MPRMTIYLPEDLKARMDAEQDANWSRLAAAAFEVELARRVKFRRDLTRQGVARRLRASRLSGASEQLQAGRAAGTRWASEEAEWIHLVRLAEASRDGEGSLWETTPKRPYDLVDVLLVEIDEEAFSDDTHRAWFRQKYGLEPGSTDYLRGFVDGALEIMEAVAQDVEGDSLAMTEDH